MSSRVAQRQGNDPLKRLTERLKEKCIKRIKDSRKENLDNRRKFVSPNDQSINSSAQNQAPELNNSEEQRQRARVLMEDEGISSTKWNTLFQAEESTYDNVNIRDITESNNGRNGKKIFKKLKSSYKEMIDLISNEMKEDSDDDAFWDNVNVEEVEAALLSVEDALTLELQLQEEEDELNNSNTVEAQVDEYESSYYESEEKELELALESLALDQENVDGSSLLCPVCQLHHLIETQDKCGVHCECGLLMNFEYDGLSLENLRCQLSATYAEHSESRECRGSLSFECRHDFNITVLAAKCSLCDFYRVVI